MTDGLLVPSSGDAVPGGGGRPARRHSLGTTRFAVLGPLEVRIDGRVVDLGWPKQRALLAALLLMPNRAVPIADLVEAVWGDNPPASAVNGLHKYVSTLRRLIGPDRLITRQPGYLLAVGTDELDLLQFEALAAEQRWPEALALWRGEPCEDVELGDSWRAQLQALRESREAVRGHLIDARLAAGEYEPVIPELRALVLAEPLCEQHWVRLMRALHRSGRTAEALAAFAQARTVLADELGTDPGAELQTLHAALLVGDDEPPQVRPHWVVQCQLPLDISDFVGRTEHIEDVTAFFQADGDAMPIGVVSGPPGIGKTSLAVRIAHRLRERFPDGQLYVHLGGASPSPRDSATAVADLLRELGVDSRTLPETLEARAAILRARVADRRVLLVLDDARDTAHVMPLLPGTASCGVLITSRTQLTDLPGARHLTLDPLFEDEAVELLSRIAGVGRVTGEPEHAVEVVTACGRLPLAVRIAGARLAARSSATVGEFAARLRDEHRRLDELTIGDLAVRSSLELSYRSLTEPAKNAFRRLGSIAFQHFAPWAVAALAGTADTESVLEQLLAANLLTEVRVKAGTGPRYRLHDLVAVYALELSAGEQPETTESALARLVDTALVFTDRAWRASPAHVTELPATKLPSTTVPAATPDFDVEPRSWFDLERGLLCFLITYCSRRNGHLTALAFVDRLARMWTQYGGLDDCERVCADVEAAADAAGDGRSAARAALHRAQIAHVRGDIAKATGRYIDCIDRFRRLDAVDELAHTLNLLASCRTEQGLLAEALELATRARDLASSSGNKRVEVEAMRYAARAHSLAGRHETALALLCGAAPLLDQVAEPSYRICMLHELAFAEMRGGRYERASAACEKALLLHDSKDRVSLAWLLYAKAAIEREQGHFEESARLARRIRAIFTTTFNRLGEAAAVASLAETYLCSGRIDDAIDLAAEALRLLEGVGANRQANRLRSALADAARNDPGRLSSLGNGRFN
jgi:DNA-binding SARP family transcriptional activator/tetratricopeptide (TPR) repeat protein